MMLTLDGYRREGIQYIISNGPIWALKYSDSERKQKALAFYDELSREATLLAEFSNPCFFDPSFLFPFNVVGPTVLIYYLPPEA